MSTTARGRARASPAPKRAALTSTRLKGWPMQAPPPSGLRLRQPISRAGQHEPRLQVGCVVVITSRGRANTSPASKWAAVTSSLFDSSERDVCLSDCEYIYVL